MPCLLHGATPSSSFPWITTHARALGGACCAALHAGNPFPLLMTRAINFDRF